MNPRNNYDCLTFIDRRSIVLNKNVILKGLHKLLGGDFSDKNSASESIAVKSVTKM